MESDKKRPRIVAMLGNGKIWIHSEIDLEVLILADNGDIWDVGAEPFVVAEKFLEAKENGRDEYRGSMWDI